MIPLLGARIKHTRWRFGMVSFCVFQNWSVQVDQLIWSNCWFDLGCAEICDLDTPIGQVHVIKNSRYGKNMKSLREWHVFECDVERWVLLQNKLPSCRDTIGKRYIELCYKILDFLHDFKSCDWWFGWSSVVLLVQCFLSLMHVVWFQVNWCEFIWILE